MFLKVISSNFKYTWFVVREFTEITYKCVLSDVVFLQLDQEHCVFQSLSYLFMAAVLAVLLGPLKVSSNSFSECWYSKCSGLVCLLLSPWSVGYVTIIMYVAFFSLFCVDMDLILLQNDGLKCFTALGCCHHFVNAHQSDPNTLAHCLNIQHPNRLWADSATSLYWCANGDVSEVHLCFQLLSRRLKLLNFDG